MTNPVSTPLTLDDLRARRDEIIALAAHYGASNVRVFGSIARGEARPDSDIDLLVHYGPRTTLTRIVGLQQALEALLRRSVELVDDQAIKPGLRSAILSDSISL